MQTFIEARKHRTWFVGLAVVAVKRVIMARRLQPCRRCKGREGGTRLAKKDINKALSTSATDPHMQQTSTAYTAFFTIMAKTRTRKTGSKRKAETFAKFASLDTVKEDGAVRDVSRTVTFVYFKSIWTPPREDKYELGTEELVGDIETPWLYTVCSRFVDEFFKLPTWQAGSLTGYKWVIDETACTKKALFAFMAWLKTVDLPTPDRYKSIRQLVPPKEYDYPEWAALYRLTSWMQLKKPFGNTFLHLVCRDYLKGRKCYEARLYSMIAIDMWKGGNSPLRRLLLDEMVPYVEWLDHTNGNEDDDFFRPAHHAWVADMKKFAPDMAEAFEAREIELGNFRTREEKREKREKRKTANKRRSAALQARLPRDE